MNINKRCFHWINHIISAFSMANSSFGKKTRNSRSKSHGKSSEKKIRCLRRRPPEAPGPGFLSQAFEYWNPTGDLGFFWDPPMIFAGTGLPANDVKRIKTCFPCCVHYQMFGWNVMKSYEMSAETPRDSLSENKFHMLHGAGIFINI